MCYSLSETVLLSDYKVLLSNLFVKLICEFDPSAMQLEHLGILETMFT